MTLICALATLATAGVCYICLDGFDTKRGLFGNFNSFSFIYIFDGLGNVFFRRGTNR